MRRMLGVLVFLVFLLPEVPDVSAMPSFSRKLGTDCTHCHTQVPKLNRTGYEYRLAGYRDPADIGVAEKKFELGDFFDARFQMQYVWKQHSDDVDPKKDLSSNQLEFYEFTFYPLTGSWGKYFGSIGEFSMFSDDVFEIENAFIRGVAGDANGFFQARVGVMHPWEGFGASDRPVGNIRPIFQKAPAVGSPFFLWNLDEMAVEVGYYQAKIGTSIAARVSNGIIWKEGTNPPGTAEPAQGGNLTKNQAEPGADRKNYEVFINQFITNDSALSLYYYNGTISYPDPGYEATTDVTLDTFQRLTAYGNFWVWPGKVNLLAGYSLGKDSLDDAAVKSSDGKYNGSKVGKSDGFFGEVNYQALPTLLVGARYDAYDPSDKVASNEQTAWTVSGNYYITHGLQFVMDYQHKMTEQATSGKKKDDQVVARLIFIF